MPRPSLLRKNDHTVIAVLVFYSFFFCTCDDSKESFTGPETSEVPSLTCVPYENPDDVWISARYDTVTHQGIDFSTLIEIPILAAGAGVFRKEMYFHAGVPRWQVNTCIYCGDYSIDGLFEPGNSVTEEEAERQFNLLIADGTKVEGGDTLGTLTIAPGQPYGMFHLGVHNIITGLAECPLSYSIPAVRNAILDLYRREHPGGQVCDCHIY